MAKLFRTDVKSAKHPYGGPDPKLAKHIGKPLGELLFMLAILYFIMWVAL